MQGDVSFTFLDRIEEVELNIVDRRWQSALALALTYAGSAKKSDSGCGNPVYSLV